MANAVTFLKNRAAGLLYLGLAATGFYSQFALERGSMASPERNGSLLYASGLLSLLLMNVIWLLLAYALMRIYGGRMKTLAHLLMLSVLGGSALVSGTLLLRSIPLYLYGTDLSGEAPLVIGRIAGAAGGWAGFFYSLWLIPLALLFLRDRSLPPPIRPILFLSLLTASAGYLWDFLLFLFRPGENSPGMTDYTFWGEVVLLLWLLLRGAQDGGEERTYGRRHHTEFGSSDP